MHVHFTTQGNLLVFLLLTGVVVARARMSLQTADMYATVLKDILNTCHTDTGIQIEEHDSPLKGIIVDWKTAQINGIQTAFGSGRANELLRECQVLLFEHILHFVHNFIRLFIDIRFIS